MRQRWRILTDISNHEHEVRMRTCLATLIFLLCRACAVPADYHVDQRAGDDTHDGRSPARAWRSLARVNAATFGSGDRILLRAGSVWEGESLQPRGSGTAEKPIIVSVQLRHGDLRRGNR